MRVHAARHSAGLLLLFPLLLLIFLLVRRYKHIALDMPEAENAIGIKNYPKKGEMRNNRKCTVNYIIQLNVDVLYT